MQQWLTNRREQAAGWLRMGVSPQRLALTLALGFAIGCLPLLGVTTALCALVALALRLNLPAIQAANYVAMPVQIALMWPLVRLGRWMFSSGQAPALQSAIMHGFSLQTLRSSGSVAGEALGAWAVLAAPTVLLMTICLTLVLRKVPALAEERSE
jgi:uncharacterized protein (DUF2062 family)